MLNVQIIICGRCKRQDAVRQGLIYKLNYRREESLVKQLIHNQTLDYVGYRGVRGVGGSVVMSLAAHAQDPEFKPPTGHPNTFRYFSGLYARRSYFIDIETGVGLARVFGFNHVMSLSKFCWYTCALANQAIRPFVASKLLQAYDGDNNANA